MACGPWGPAATVGGPEVLFGRWIPMARRAAPGWYPDPAGVKAWRWWDGHGWTEFASDPSGPAGARFHRAPARTSPAPPSTTGSTAEVKAATVGQAGAGRLPGRHRRRPAGGLGGAVGPSGALPQHPRPAADRGRPEPGASQSGRSEPALPLEPGGVAPFYVFLLRWQFQAAKTARFLSLPARRSPGLGVGSWFIPVVNFWFPYQSIRDCLPPGDPGRPVVARMWAFFIAVLVDGCGHHGLRLDREPDRLRLRRHHPGPRRRIRGRREDGGGAHCRRPSANALPGAVRATGPAGQPDRPWP